MEQIWLWMSENQILLLGILTIGLILMALILLIQIILNNKLKKRFLAYESGSLNKSLEEEVAALQTSVQSLKAELEAEKQKLTRFMRKEQRAIKKVKLIKYDAFANQGGKVSYALALLNEENTGIIINSVHSTDFSFSYAKEVIRGRVSQDLSKEEQQVLDKTIEDRKIEVR